MERRSDPEPEFDAFFRSVFPRLVAVASRVTGDRGAAEDAALEAMAKAHLRWKRVGSYDRPDRWVVKVAVNEALRRLPRTAPLPEAAVVGDPADAVVLRQTLAAALGGLPRRQREVIALRYLAGLPEVEVAETLRISHGTVKTHLRRGLQRLRLDIGARAKEEGLARLA